MYALQLIGAKYLVNMIKPAIFLFTHNNSDSMWCDFWITFNGSTCHGSGSISGYSDSSLFLLNRTSMVANNFQFYKSLASFRVFTPCAETWSKRLVRHIFKKHSKITITVKSYERHTASNQRQPNWLFNGLFRLTTEQTSSNPLITDQLWGKSIGDEQIPFTRGQ